MSEWAIVVLTGVLVLVSGYYAWQNKRMVDELRRQRMEQRRLQLYERRAAVLRGALRCLGHITRVGGVRDETIPCWLEATSEREYLLERDLCEYLDEIYNKCLLAHTLRNMLQDEPVGERRTQLVEEESRIVGWLVTQSAEIRRRFVPYLRVEE